MRKQVCAFVIAATLATTTCCTPRFHRGSAGESPDLPQPQTTRKLLEGVPVFGEATPTLYRGAQPSKEGFEALAKMGIGIVVDLRGSSDSERKQVNSLGMQYVDLHWFCVHPRDEVFARFLTLLRQNPGKKVFVHCRTGYDRTGMMIAAYRMVEQGWSAAEARKEMERNGFTWFHHLICPTLASYEEDFPHRFKTKPAFEHLRHARNQPDVPPFLFF